MAKFPVPSGGVPGTGGENRAAKARLLRDTPGAVRQAKSKTKLKQQRAL